MSDERINITAVLYNVNIATVRLSVCRIKLILSTKPYLNVACISFTVETWRVTQKVRRSRGL